jgi:hypothetical protein
VLPQALREDLLQRRPPRRRRAARAAGWLVAALLAAALALQAVLLAPELEARLPAPVAAAVEGAEPWHDALLRMLGRPLPPHRAPERIALEARDVREHPAVEDALLVTGVMVNEAPLPQPWPGLRLLLRDLQGRPLAERTFPPSMYLPEPPAEPVFPAGARAAFRLELDAPPVPVIGFEIRFL